jgi:hypothetical protein
MAIRSTFVPAPPPSDNLTFAQMSAQDDGVFAQTAGVGGPPAGEPAFVNINGEIFPRDLSTGDLGNRLQADGVPSDALFRRLPGEFTLNFIS